MPVKVDAEAGIEQPDVAAEQVNTEVAPSTDAKVEAKTEADAVAMPKSIVTLQSPPVET